MKTIRDMLYPGCTAKILFHYETCNSLANKRPRDPSRFLGFDASSLPDSIADMTNMLALDPNVAPMFNSYKVGTYENTGLLIAMQATAEVGIDFMLNIDKGAYVTPTATFQEQQASLTAYLHWCEGAVFSRKNVCRDKAGKIVVTHFANSPKAADLSASLAMFKAVELMFPYISFVYNVPALGGNQMAWVQQDLQANLDWWCRTYARDSLNFPCFYTGFNDDEFGHSAWGGPPRIWPTGGPSAEELQACFATINKYYSVANQPQFMQGVTWNDCDEGTYMGTVKGSMNKWFLPVPPAVNHGELWLDGNKLGNVTPGTHALTIVKVYQDGSIVKNQIPLEIV